MALQASTSSVVSYGQTQGQYLDLSDVLAALIRSDNTAFISRVPMTGVATETQHSWIEDSLNPMTVVAASTIGTSAASVTLFTTGATVVPWVTIGALIRDQAVSPGAMAEIMQVTGTSGGSLVVARGYGATTATAHAAGTYSVIAVPAQEDADMPGDISRSRSKVSNFVEVFLRGVKVSYTSQAINQAGVPSEFGYQTANRLKEVMRELNTVSILGVANNTTGTGSDTAYRTLGGMLQFAVGGSIGGIQVLQTGATNSTAEQISPDVLNTMGSAIWYNGGMTAGPYHGFILASGKQKRRIAQFDASYRRMDYNSNRVGFTTEKFLSDLGYEFEIIVDPAMPDDVVIMGDLNRLKLMPLQGQAMRVEDIAKTGRALKGMITGEYTFEPRNSVQTTAMHSALS